METHLITCQTWGKWKFLRQKCRHFSQHDTFIHFVFSCATSAPDFTSSPCMQITVKCLPQCIPLQSKESTLQFPPPLLSRDVCVQTSMTISDGPFRNFIVNSSEIHVAVHMQSYGTIMVEQSWTVSVHSTSFSK